MDNTGSGSSYRLGALISAAAWLAALALPVQEVVLSSRVHGLHPERFSGLRAAEFGWVGVVSLCFAWYANALLAVCWWRMARGRQPGVRLSCWALVLAASVMVPHVSWAYVEQYGLLPGLFVGVGLAVWLLAFVVVAGWQAWQSAVGQDQ